MTEEGKLFFSRVGLFLDVLSWVLTFVSAALLLYTRHMYCNHQYFQWNDDDKGLVLGLGVIFVVSVSWAISSVM